MTDATAIQVFTALLEARTGQQLASGRTWRIDTALRPLLRERGLATLDALVALLLGGRDAAIGDRIVEALVNGETSFFRDPAAFDLAAGVLDDVARTGRRARVWSVGCSSGQEPLSLAMLFAERADAQAAPTAPLPEIVASDVSEAAIARARAARFSQFEVQRGLPIRRLMRWFESDGDEWVADRRLRDAVTCHRINIAADRAPPGRFDLVLCRNVLLYLGPDTKAKAFATLASAMRPDGLLVLGAGETVTGQSTLFAPSERYRGCYELARRARYATTA